MIINKMFFIFSIILGLLISLELFLNIIYWLIKGKLFYETRGVYRFDRQIGYRVKENLKRELPKAKKNVRDSEKAYYYTQKYGFRWYLSPNASKTVWLVGDSFTESVYFSNDKTFCGLLYMNLNKNINVINSGLGGCRQVHMFEIVKKYYSSISPDILFVQISHNDFYDIAIGLENPHDKYSNRLCRQIGKNELIQFADNIIIFNLLRKMLYNSNDIIEKTRMEKNQILKDYVNSQIWFDSIIKYCIGIDEIAKKASFNTIFYIPPAPFAGKCSYEQASEQFQEIDICSAEAVSLFQRYYERLEEMSFFMSKKGITVFNFNENLRQLSPKEIFELFIDRSHLSEKGHQWFSKVLQNMVVTRL